MRSRRAARRSIIGFTSTPSAAVTVEGGNGNDTIRVFGTNTVDRDILNGTGFLRVSTIQDGVPTISDEQQLLVMPTGIFGWFTLTYNGHTTAQLHIGDSESVIQTALRGLTGLTDPLHTVTVTQPVGGTFLLQFDKQLGDVAQLVATLTPHVIVNSSTSQELDMPTGATGVGFFTLHHGVTHRRSSCRWTQRRRPSMPPLVAAGIAVSNVTGAAGKFTITLQHATAQQLRGGRSCRS